MSWFNSSWGARFKVTSDNTKVAEAIDNVYLDLSNAPAGFWTKVKSDGADIRVTQSNGTTEVAREVVAIDTTAETGELHFKATGLSTSADTDFYIYYDNSSATEPAVTATNGRNAVWSEYELVYHLTSPTTITSSTGSNNGTAYNTPTSATGKLGDGAEFNGTNEWIDSGLALSATAMTVSCWYKGTNAAERLLSTTKTGTVLSSEFDITNSVSGGTIDWAWCDPAYKGGTGTATINDGINFHYIVSAQDSGGTGKGYVDGVEDFSVALSSFTNNNTQTMWIMRYPRTDTAYTDGIIDEVRARYSKLSANYISTEYNNQNSNSTFWTVGSEETESATIGPFPTFFKVVF